MSPCRKGVGRCGKVWGRDARTMEPQAIENPSWKDGCVGRSTRKVWSQCKVRIHMHGFKPAHTCP
eukprot:365094-Chlamydomonas_euryale.AAC.6